MNALTEMALAGISREQLAERLHNRAEMLPEDLPVDRAEYTLFPLSLAQQHLFAHEQMDGAASAYNIAAALAIDGELDTDTLGAALQTILDRHEALRTRFSYKQGQVWQLVERAQELDFTRADFSSLPADAAEATALEEMHRDAIRPFDLLAGPMLRCCLFRIGPDRHLLSLNLHHIVSDYLSMDLLVRELNTLYRAGPEQLHTTLPPLRLHYPDFVLWERAFLVSPRAESQRAFWLERLANIPALTFPDPPTSAPRSDGCWNTFRFDGDLVERLRERARSCDVTMFMLGLAAVQQLVSAFCGQSDIALGTPISTRRVPELDQCIGLLLNTLVIRVDAGACADGSALLAEVRQRCSEAFEHKDYPYEGLLRDIRGQRQQDEAPYRVRYVYRRITGAGIPAESSLSTREIELERRQAKFDLLISFNEADDHLFGEFEYRTCVLRPETAEVLVRQFGEVLAWLADAESGMLADLNTRLREGREAAESARKRERSSKLQGRLKAMFRPV